MPRPKLERTNRDQTVDLMENSQKQSLGALSAFHKQICDEQVMDGVQHDDNLFATIVDLAIREYGIRQAELARQLKVSAPAVARWSKQINLPATYARPSIVGKIASIIKLHIDAQEHLALPRGRLAN
jgi:hypothetical protein